MPSSGRPPITASREVRSGTGWYLPATVIRVVSWPNLSRSTTAEPVSRLSEVATSSSVPDVAGELLKHPLPVLQDRDGARQLLVGCLELAGASAVALVQLRLRQRRPEEVAQTLDDEQLFGVGSP